MSLVALASRLAETAPVPDGIARAGIRYLVARTRRRLERVERAPGEAEFVATMARRPIAEFTSEANAQHYEVPAAFFRLVLGPRLKYSCCLFDRPRATLAEAEERALAETALHADLANGQDILELGCGWGSLSLWMAARYPASRIVSVSNSAGQRRHIEARAAALRLENLRVITADMNDFQAPGRFDRVVSVEMFEHIANWPQLLRRVAGWLQPDGRLFLHVFSHRSQPYRFDPDNRRDWIAQHFFTGGVMPSHGLVRHFDDIFQLEAEWRWSGEHYRRTAEAWLKNFDRHAAEIRPIMREAYGDDAYLWTRRWRLFFLATAGLFGDRGGTTWGVSHYRLRLAG